MRRKVRAVLGDPAARDGQLNPLAFELGGRVGILEEAPAGIVAFPLAHLNEIDPDRAPVVRSIERGIADAHPVADCLALPGRQLVAHRRQVPDDDVDDGDEGCRVGPERDRDFGYASHQVTPISDKTGLMQISPAGWP
jgi:hypothetical protein